tara:strand:+ start:186 stop:476 length:291 start_codon:yes stop_codon:yes gene_type:complete
MSIEEACHSLKLECALRELGFVDIGWKCVAHAGMFFVQPVGWGNESELKPEDDLLGFLLRKHIMAKRKQDPRLLCLSAGKALDLAQEITNSSLNDW